MPDKSQKIAIAADHAGFELKEALKAMLARRGIPFDDLGAYTVEALDDYPDLVSRMARAVSGGTYARGIGLCGAGIGASITANRFPKVRAALCTSPAMAELSRRHNDSNVLILGGRLTSPADAEAILDAWLKGTFEGGRHQKRVEMLEELQ